MLLYIGKNWSPQRLTVTPWTEEDGYGNMQDWGDAESGSSCEPDDRFFFLRQTIAMNIGL